MTAKAMDAMSEAADQDTALFVSPITACEVGMLAARGRLKLLVTPDRWFRRLTMTPGLRLADMSPDILVASSFLPGVPPRDPSDRIMAATARDLGPTLITRHRPLLDYAAQGHLSALAC